MTIDEIKSTLIRNKAIHDQQVLAAEKSIESIKDHLQEIKEQDYEIMRDFGIPIDVMRTLDLEKLSTDEEYLNSIKKKLNEIVDSAMHKLEEEINA